MARCGWSWRVAHDDCICDDFRFPPETSIMAGLTRLTRQTGTFAEFRRALLRGASIRTTAAWKSIRSGLCDTLPSEIAAA